MTALSKAGAAMLGLWGKVSPYVTPLLLGLGAVVGVILGLKRHVSKERDEAVEQERASAEREAYYQRSEHEAGVEGDLEELQEEQEKRREREQDEDPRSRFGRQPWD